MRPAKQYWHSGPVTFCYKKELDPNGIPQFGLVAEEVEKVNPDLVARAAEGKVLYRPLWSGERDVAKRVPERARPSPAVGGDRRTAAEANRSTYCDCTKKWLPKSPWNLHHS